MLRLSLITRAAVSGRATAFSLIVLLAAGGHHPAQARVPLQGILAGTAAPGKSRRVAANPLPDSNIAP